MICKSFKDPESPVQTGDTPLKGFGVYTEGTHSPVLKLVAVLEAHVFLIICILSCNNRVLGAARNGYYSSMQLM